MSDQDNTVDLPPSLLLVRRAQEEIGRLKQQVKAGEALHAAAAAYLNEPTDDTYGVLYTATMEYEAAVREAGGSEGRE